MVGAGVDAERVDNGIGYAAALVAHQLPARFALQRIDAGPVFRRVRICRLDALVIQA